MRRGDSWWAIGLGLVIAATFMSLLRVGELEALESRYETRPYTLAELQKGPDSRKGAVRIGATMLRKGQDGHFEFCAGGPLSAERWAGRVTIRLGKDGETVFDTPLGEGELKRARRNSDGACLTLGGGAIKFDGEYTMAAVWDKPPPAELLSVNVQARIMGRPPLGDSARLHVGMLGLGIALILVGLWRRPAEFGALPHPPPMRSVLGASIAVAALVGGTQLALFGSSLGVIKGVLLTGVQAGLTALLCLKLGAGPVRQQLALVRPSRTAVQLPVALATGVLLVFSARIAMRLVPSTGEAPIQTFLSWPSGALAFGALGVLLPLAEEIFFRGYLYRLTLPMGKIAAFTLTWGLFVALHAQQAWGNWGALLSIAITGAALTALRAWSGSTLVPAAAHLLYNFMLAMASL